MSLPCTRWALCFFALWIVVACTDYLLHVVSKIFPHCIGLFYCTSYKTWRNKLPILKGVQISLMMVKVWIDAILWNPTNQSYTSNAVDASHFFNGPILNDGLHYGIIEIQWYRRPALNIYIYTCMCVCMYILLLDWWSIYIPNMHTHMHINLVAMKFFLSVINQID